MDALGSYSLLLAFSLCLYAILAALIGQWKDKPLLRQSSERAVVAVSGLVVVGTFCLAVLLLRDDFRVAYVASHSNRALPIYFKFAALWSGQEGSLLWWSCLMSLFAATAVSVNRRTHPHLMPYAVAMLMTVLGFFLVLNNFVVSPFTLLAMQTPQGPQMFAPPDGGGLNPLLQHPAMVIHPPMLYLGFVGFSVPFAFALSALISRTKGEQWIHITRRWTMIAWMFLTIGILLGGRWAYAVLGWGGYWGWDPVENASLLPWLTGTAFLHSVMMQEKRGMMKVWNMVLIFATFLLCIFGTFLTRSGVLSSVHAFAQSAIGPYFSVFLSFLLLLTGAVLFWRLDFLKSENQLDSLASRESSFLFNNLILLASCFAVLWGTLFPLLSEAVRGVKISVGAPYFNKVQIPIGLFLLFLTGVGPLFAWRRTSVDSLKRNFTRPLIFGAIVAIVCFIFGARNFYALMTIFLAFFVIGTIALEFFRGARVIHQKEELGWAGAMVELTRRNTRRYGGYVIHFGIALLFIGFVGNAFGLHEQAEVMPGDEVNVRDYRFVVQSIDQDETDNHIASRARIDVYKGGSLLATMAPERRFFKASQQPTTEVAIWPHLSKPLEILRHPNADIYLVFSGMSDDNQRAIIQVYINPLVLWVWLGGAVMVLGTLIALIPSRPLVPGRPSRRRKPAKERHEVPA